MNRTQDTFLSMLAAQLSERGFESTVDASYANVGIFRGRRAGTLVEVVAVRYGFHLSSSPAYATFTIDSDRGHEEVPYVKPADLQSALDKILAHLPAGKMRRARKSGRARRLEAFNRAGRAVTVTIPEDDKAEPVSGNASRGNRRAASSKLAGGAS